MIDLGKDNLIGLPDKIMAEHRDYGYTIIQFPVKQANKTPDRARVPVRALILNLLFWEPNLKFGILPDVEDWTSFKSMTTNGDAIATRIMTPLYKKALRLLPNVPHMRIVLEYTYNIDRISNFVQRYMGDQMPSIDALALAQLFDDPELEDLVNCRFDDANGTQAAEVLMSTLSSKFISAVKNLDKPYNCLKPYFAADTLKTNQVPQFAMAYCCRSDIDDTMMSHVISESSFSGLKSIADYAVEYHAGKKSVYFSRTSIRKSQYLARKIRLVVSPIQKIYPGSCGSQGTIPFVISSKWAGNYIDRIVVDNGQRVLLDKNNLANYVDRPIQLVSQFACRHIDGICEHCAGYGEDMLIKFMPADIHIGIVSSSKVTSVVSQMILSTKHLIKTMSLIYNLPEHAKQFLTRLKNMLYILEMYKGKLDKMAIRVPKKTFIAPLSDLICENLPDQETFSKIGYFDVLVNNEVIDRIDLETDICTPFFSEKAIEWMHDHYNELVQNDDDTVTIPLATWDVKDPFLGFVIMNDDMRAFCDSIEHFLSTSMENYTTVAGCITDFNNLIYRKTKVNSFYIETVLRSFLVRSDYDYRLPVLEDFEHVKFKNLASKITNSSITTKLAFEHVKEHMGMPTTPLLAKEPGLYAPYFGVL